jgi:hypothetical protein
MTFDEVGIAVFHEGIYVHVGISTALCKSFQA